jgi:hypothetical protein
VYLLTSVETSAFAATGWLFGKEVHREQAMDAKQQASSAMEQATQARKETMGVVDGAMTAMHEAMEQTAQARKEAMDMASKIMDAMQQATEGKPQAMNTTQNAAHAAGRKARDEQGQALATRMQNHSRNLEHLKQVLTNKLPDRTVQGEVEKIMKEMEELTSLAIALYPPAH